MQVHVGWLEDGTAIFAFRGTATVQDGLADVKIMRLDVSYLRELFPGARAHLGAMPCLLAGCCRSHVLMRTAKWCNASGA